MEMPHRIKLNYQISIDVAIMLTGCTTLLNIQWRSYRIYYSARDRLEKRYCPAAFNMTRARCGKIFRTSSEFSRRREKWRKKRHAEGDERKAASRYIGRVTWTTRWKREPNEKGRESFYVPTLLIGPHPNFKQVRNSDPGRGAHRDVDRRIKWRTFAILESRYYFLLSLCFSYQYRVQVYQICTKQLWSCILSFWEIFRIEHFGSRYLDFCIPKYWKIFLNITALNNMLIMYLT